MAASAALISHIGLHETSLSLVLEMGLSWLPAALPAVCSIEPLPQPIVLRHLRRPPAPSQPLRPGRHPRVSPDWPPHLWSQLLDRARRPRLVRAYSPRGHEEAGLDPGPQDRQRNAVPIRSQELERTSDVLCRFRPAAAWRTTTAQDP